MLYTPPWSGFEHTTSVVIGTDCIGSCSPTTIRSRSRQPLTDTGVCVSFGCIYESYFHVVDGTGDADIFDAFCWTANKTNNRLSSQIIEHTNCTTYMLMEFQVLASNWHKNVTGLLKVPSHLLSNGNTGINNQQKEIHRKRRHTITIKVPRFWSSCRVSLFQCDVLSLISNNSN
jgi:hypothetical protein